MNILNEIAAARAKIPGVDLANREVFVDNLSLVAQLMVASEGMLRHAILRLAGMEGEFEAKLLAYFRDHLEEETDHFAWICADLAGEPVFRNWAAAELAGMQYFLIYHDHPAAILGYMAVLECFPMPLERVSQLENLHGEHLLRTIRYHAVHDRLHGRVLADLLDSAPSTLQPTILANALRTVQRIGEAQQLFGGHHG